MRRRLLVAAAAAALALWWWSGSLQRTGPEGDTVDAVRASDSNPGGGFRSSRGGAAGSGATAAARRGHPARAGRPELTDSKRSTGEADSGLEVVVLSDADGRPIAEATVAFGPLDGDERRELLTDEEGRTVASLEPGEYQVSVEREGYLPNRTRFGVPATGATVRRLVRLTPAVSVDGFVVDQDGAPVSGAGITFMPDQRSRSGRPLASSGSSDAEGAFSVEVSPGTYRVRATKRPHPSVTLRDVEVGDGGRGPIRLQMQLRDDTILLSGRILDENADSPVNGARVQLRRRQGRRTRTVASVRTGADGEFRLELLPQSGLELRATASGYGAVTLRNLDLREERRLDVEMTAYSTFAVRVLDSAGAPVEGARVHGVDERSRRILQRTPEGRYYTPRYPVRLYADALQHGQGVSSEVMLESHRPEVELVLQPGCELKGRVAAEDGSPITSFVVTVRPQGLGSLSRRFYAEDGSFHLRDMPAGQATVSVSASGFERYRDDLVLDEDQVSWLEIGLARRQRRRGNGGSIDFSFSIPLFDSLPRP